MKTNKTTIKVTEYLSVDCQPFQELNQYIVDGPYINRPCTSIRLYFYSEDEYEPDGVAANVTKKQLRSLIEGLQNLEKELKE